MEADANSGAVAVAFLADHQLPPCRQQHHRADRDDQAGAATAAREAGDHRPGLHRQSLYGNAGLGRRCG